MKFSFLMLAAILFLAVPFAHADRMIHESFSLEGIERLSVDGHVGRILVNPEESEKIELDLKLEPDKGKHPDLDSVRLIQDQDGKTFKLSLDVPFRRDDMIETWTLRVPARLALKLNMDVGDLVVEGIHGGLDLSVKVGKIEANAPEGEVLAKTNVGDIQIHSSTKSYGVVIVDANVGDTSLSINDHKVVYSKSPGPGNRVMLDGPGRDRIELSTNVGDAELKLE